ncbi:MAG: family 78 glycoside hydrolase catalytic domain [Spirochaetes bacterium]|nr:family 78 glycoside hydrolase catalytic domain [Spirochaetota bacterium]
MRSEHITIEYREHPLGVDISAPRFGWTADQTPGKQTAYAIIAAVTPERCNENDADLWNTGKVLSPENAQIAYAGKTLPSRTRVYCAVRLWDENDNAGPWQNTWFETGFMNESDWQAHWIDDMHAPHPDDYRSGAAPMFRREFQLPEKIVSARAYIAGLGMYELFINGSRIGDAVLAPAQTNYDERKLRHMLYPFKDRTKKRVLYNVYDITAQLTGGLNAVGIILGTGWYDQRDRTVEGWMWYDSPRVIAQLEIIDASGRTHIIGTDTSWKSYGAGPIIHNGIFTGEIFDARRDISGWANAGFSDASWIAARRARPPSGTLHAQLSPPDIVTNTFTPAAVTGPDNVRRFDAGRNVTGWARIRTKGEKGRTITIRYVEDSGQDYSQTDTFICGGESEMYEPSFTWHSFRYVDVIGAPESFSEQDIDIREVHADVLQTGSFHCSDETLNDLYRLFCNTQLANMHCGVPSDCPHRERLGYTGDGQIAAEAAMYAFDMSAFYTKWVTDIADAQNSETGFVPHTAPFGGGGGGQPWGSALVIIPWLMHRFYGDRRILDGNYDAMKKWLRYFAACRNERGIVTHEEPGSWFLGDWCTPTGERPKLTPEYVNTCYLGYNALLMKDIARALGNETDAAFYAELHAAVAATVHHEYFDAVTGDYSIGSEGANEFALMFGLVPDEHRARVAENIARHVARNGYHFDTGIFGTPLLLAALTDCGFIDDAFRIMTVKDFPSFGHMLASGATTLWEHWRGGGSRNHPMFGSVCAWLFRSLAGIVPAAPGFSKVRIRPLIPKGLSSVTAEHLSIRGLIAVSWEQTGESISISVVIPPHADAHIELPRTGRWVMDGRPEAFIGTPLSLSSGTHALTFSGK